MYVYAQQQVKNDASLHPTATNTNSYRKHRITHFVKVAHLALCVSLLFTAALNSGAGDAVRGHRLHLLGARRSVSFDWLVSLIIVLNDVRWLLCMSVLSSVGLWLTEVAYAFCVVRGFVVGTARVYAQHACHERTHTRTDVSVPSLHTRTRTPNRWT